MKINSNKETINCRAENIFDFISNFKNFEHLVPQDKVNNWNATENECSFAIPNLATIAMEIAEKQAPNRLLIKSKQPSPFDFSMTVELEGNETVVSSIEFAADVNPMLGMMVKNPLTNFVNILNAQLKSYAENTLNT